MRSAYIALRVVAALAAAAPLAIGRRSLMPLAEGLCRALEHLGPAAIKFGQLLSVRPDLVGAEGAEVFERLQDSAPPLSTRVIREVVERELLLPIEELFAEFDWQPVGCASVSQVHRARLACGDEVAVKVQRPGVRKLLHGDLLAVEKLARLFSWLPFLPHRFDLAAFVGHLREASLRETDFRQEAQIAERFRRAFRGEPQVIIPRVHWSHTTGRVLTTGFLTGHKISHALSRSGEGFSGLAELGARLFFRQVFEFGLFHADLHPSNIFITDDGKIGYLDFGIWGALSFDERTAMLGTLVGLLNRDSDVAFANLEKLGVTAPPASAKAFTDDIGQVLAHGVGPSLSQTSLARIGRGILKAVRRHRVRVPHKYALLIKALITVEGAARGLHGEFDMEGAARDYLGPLVMLHYGPVQAAELVWRLATLTALAQAQRQLPD
jgi:ubiquinone biosynthesis protein